MVADKYESPTSTLQVPTHGLYARKEKTNKSFVKLILPTLLKVRDISLLNVILPLNITNQQNWLLKRLLNIVKKGSKFSAKLWAFFFVLDRFGSPQEAHMIQAIFFQKSSWCSTSCGWPYPFRGHRTLNFQTFFFPHVERLLVGTRNNSDYVWQLYSPN